MEVLLETNVVHAEEELDKVLAQKIKSLRTKYAEMSYRKVKRSKLT